MVLFHQTLHSFQGVGYPGINSFQVPEGWVDALSPLIALPSALHLYAIISYMEANGLQECASWREHLVHKSL